jgi:hypothetical protein
MNENSADRQTDGPVLVVDVPQSLSAAEASRMLSAPMSRGYYLKGVTAGEPLRAVYARYASDTNSKAPEELQAMDMVEAHPRETPTRIVKRLCEAGIYRSPGWVSKTREELLASPM